MYKYIYIYREREGERELHSENFHFGTFLDQYALNCCSSRARRRLCALNRCISHAQRRFRIQKLALAARVRSKSLLQQCSEPLAASSKLSRVVALEVTSRRLQDVVMLCSASLGSVNLCTVYVYTRARTSIYIYMCVYI